MISSHLLHELKLSDLSLMVELSETHSLRELARRHSMNPSQLSKTIKRIEAKIGLPLLNRSSQKMSFTLEGMQFLNVAREILRLSPSLISGNVENPPRTYVLASSSFFNQHLLSHCLGKLSQMDDKTRFRLIEMRRKDLILSGIKSVFELALFTNTLNWPRSWSTKKLGYTRSALYGRMGHPLGARCSESEALRYKFVVPIGFTKNGIQDGEDACPVTIQDRIHGNGCMTGATALGFIRNSDQITYLPQIVAKEALARKEIMEISVGEWKEKKEPVYLAAQGDAVPQKLFEQLCREISRALEF